MGFLYFGIWESTTCFWISSCHARVSRRGLGSEGWSFGVWDIGQLGERKLQ